MVNYIPPTLIRQTPDNNESQLSTHHFWLKRLNQNITENMENENLTNAFLARKMNVSESHFYRLVKDRTGKSPNLYVRELKLNFAKTLLESGKFKHLKTVAYQVGFRRVDYFSKLFEKQFGVRPKLLVNSK